ncbi:precorrin-6A reductase [Poseidonocella pacifica]|uniref:Precorrin-6A reductase n=1 Tax=Poseidonocella pacifica TaxID=871651 RepID=A0A1I0YNE3_9RHOB|nr:precorrin-6A/cobalt-precorrin-6A reductase [Poseidonocella pacifica]SFB14742.1 precorrin-6A reductase [Poseidonocella pacifica]
MERYDVLILAGSGEARSVAAGLAEAGVAALMAQRRPPRTGETYPLPLHVGAFDSASDFVRFLEEHSIRRVLDASHPFAGKFSHRAAELSVEAGCAYLRLTRAPWVAAPQDRWIDVATESQAAEHISPGARVFVATGRGTEAQFANLEGREVLFRVLGQHGGKTGAARHIRYVPAKGPFTVASEESFLRRAEIDWLVCRNAGGEGAFPKLAAARELGLPVVMVRRPTLPEPKVQTVAEALEWAMS